MLVRLHNDTAIQDNLLHFTSAHSTTAEYKAGYIMTRCHRTALTATGNGLHYSCLYTATQLLDTVSCILKVSILTITITLILINVIVSDKDTENCLLDVGRKFSMLK